jgi:hypothetical protein
VTYGLGVPLAKLRDPTAAPTGIPVPQEESTQ